MLQEKSQAVAGAFLSWVLMTSAACDSLHSPRDLGGRRESSSVARSGSPPRVQSRAPAAPSDVFPVFHAHNDYLHERPLWDALEAGVSSVEADVWKFWNGLGVAHFPVFGKSGSFEGWYLGPWRNSLEDHGPKGWRYLWIDIKGPEDSVKDALSVRLRTMRNLISQSRGEWPRIILSGMDRVKRDLASELAGEGGATIFENDSHSISSHDLPRSGESDPWGWYSLSWVDRFSWDGNGCMPSTDWIRLKQEVRLAHRKGRRIRYFHVPATQEWVAAARAAKVDLIDVDDLRLAGISEKRRGPCVQGSEQPIQR